MPDREFKSKQDWWLMAIVGMALIALPFVIIGSALAEGWSRGAIGPFLSALAAPLIVFSVAWPVRYRLTSEHLVIRSGFLLRWRIPIARVESVRKTRNPLSSPTWSLDRIRINYVAPTGGARWVMISPEPRREFYDALMERVPGLQRDGEGLQQINPIR